MPPLDILLCTLDAGIQQAAGAVLSPQEGIRWIISMQYTDESYLAHIPAEWAARDDVQVLHLAGAGLCRNRNHAQAASQADWSLICDDDCRYTPAQLERLRQTLADCPSTDIVLIKQMDYDGRPMKPYPLGRMTYTKALRKRGYYPSSVEIVLSRKARERLRWDERFGLGTEPLHSGEEEVLLYEAVKLGLRVEFIPLVVGRTSSHTTGERLLEDVGVQRAKGAVFALTRRCPLYFMLKESLSRWLHQGAHPFTLFKHMREGAQFIRRS